MGTLKRAADGRLVRLTTEHVVGRLSSCGLCLSRSFVSLAHALIRWNGACWELRDLGSTNGTYLDGVRLQSGQSVRLQLGSSLTFGDVPETWEMSCESPPSPAAIPLDGSEPSRLTAGTITLFEKDEPIATIYPEGERWYLEVGDATDELRAGQQFAVGGREWKFECPHVASPTSETEPDLPRLGSLVLEFDYSNNEEFVEVSFSHGGERRSLSGRACLYLALVLARKRLSDQRAGHAEHGWVDVDDLLRMIPEYSSYAALNVEIHRLRRLFGESGVTESTRIVERRRGQVRLGTDRLVLRKHGLRQADEQSAELS